MPKSKPPGDDPISAEEARSKTLRYLGVEESTVQQLRELDVEEAIWRIDHERNQIVRHAGKVHQFLMDECVKGRPKTRRERKVNEAIVTITPQERRAGTRLA